MEQKTNVSPFQKQQLLLSPKDGAPSQVTKEQLDTNSNLSQAESKINIIKLESTDSPDLKKEKE